eukprot:6921150-Alexandrium_andersonii.AAC.1
MEQLRPQSTPWPKSGRRPMPSWTRLWSQPRRSKEVLDDTYVEYRSNRIAIESIDPSSTNVN